MVIAFSCTKDWYYYLVVNLYSLLKHNKVKKIYLLLETNKKEDVKYLKQLSKKYKVEFVLININNYQKNYLKEDCPNANTVYSNMCFSRLMLADFVCEDKVLYIDTDALVLKDISHVWEIDNTDYYLIGVKDYGVININYLETLNLSGRYINSGFVVFNLKKIREDGIVQKWFDIINERELKFPDQDAMNIVCTDKEMYIPSMYNYGFGCMVDIFDPNMIRVIHYLGVKDPWVADKIFAEYWYNTEIDFINEIVKGNKKSVRKE